MSECRREFCDNERDYQDLCRECYERQVLLETKETIEKREQMDDFCKRHLGGLTGFNYEGEI